jgi:4-hydroxybenzoate polyprenyltransferase/phosphoserine phosphatase
MQNQARDPSVNSPAPVASSARGVPLCVDLDGTLVKSDMLMESLAAVLKRAPFLVLALPFWLARGRAALKHELAQRAGIDVAGLPYDENVLAMLRAERDAGRTLVLATACDETLARAIAGHLGLFDEVIASDGRRNMKREVKARELIARYGEGGFDYVGEDRHDLPVWAPAREAYLVGPNAAIASRLRRAGKPIRAIERDLRPALAVARGLRVYQWAKNLLVFVPLFTAHLYLEPASLAAALLAFIAFSLVASSVYLANDLADLADDRRHPTKRRRPIAAGELPIVTAIALLPVLLFGAAAIAALLPWTFGALLLAYVATNLAYSLALKRVPLLDVFVLAGLYTLRILAGAAAIEVPVSHWLLAFSLFAFLSLALAKRFVEVANVAARDEVRVGGRGYVAQDGALLGMLGTASGYLSVLVFALYITSPQVASLYTAPAILWFACPLLLYWISRVWFLAQRGQLHEDPLLFALRDPPSYATGLLILGVMVAAT